MPSPAESKRLSLATLLSPVTESVMPYMGEELHIRWRLGRLTPAFQAEATANQGDPVRDAASLCKLLVSWDLEGADGNPYPITPEALAELPTTFLGAVSEFLASAVLPKARSEASFDGSSAPAEN